MACSARATAVVTKTRVWTGRNGTGMVRGISELRYV